MGTMVVSLDDVQRGSFAEPFGPWRRRGLVQERLASPDAAAVLPTSAIEALKGIMISKKSQLGANPRLAEATQGVTEESVPIAATVLQESPPSTPEPERSSTSAASSRHSNSSASASSTSPSTSTLAFTSPPSPSLSLGSLSLASCSSSPVAPRQAIKRRRPVTDVDGPNTAALACKKRRLRLELITSRLSQPFSLPATHILNREAVAAGDKRFLKLAAVVAARKLTAPVTLAAGGAGQGSIVVGPGGMPLHSPHHPAQSEILRRAAILNRFRLRICVEAQQRGDKSVVEVAGSAALLSGTAGLHGLGFVANARMPPGVTAVARPPDASPPTPILRLPPSISNPPFPHPLSRAAAVARSSPPGSPSKALKPKDPAEPKLPPSPRLKALLSPELNATRNQITRSMEEDEIDDDNLAFPTSEHESRYESGDDSDDVYADFSVIFGGGSDLGSEDEEDRGSEHDHYEDYMDDLDGIPYTFR